MWHVSKTFLRVDVYFFHLLGTRRGREIDSRKPCSFWGYDLLQHVYCLPIDGCCLGIDVLSRTCTRTLVIRVCSVTHYVGKYECLCFSYRN